MRDSVQVMGMVMKSSTVGEFDKRLVILTKERGKIVAFARGARRPGNALMAPCRPFAFGTFHLAEGRDSYRLLSADISNYFQEVSLDIEQVCYGQYFLEFADYYTRENVNETELLMLLYQSLRALSKPALPNPLIRRIFELRTMVINGEYTEHPPLSVSVSANYTWEFVIASPISSLYTFYVTEEVLEEFQRSVERNIRKHIDREFYSLEILSTLASNSKNIY